MVKDSNRHFPKEDMQITSKHMKRCLKLLILGKSKSNPQWNTTLSSLRWIWSTKDKQKENVRNWPGYGKVETTVHCWWECKTGTASLDNSMMFSQHHSLWVFLKNTQRNSKQRLRYLYTNAHSIIIQNSQKMEAIHMSINRSMDKQNMVSVYVHTYACAHIRTYLHTHTMEYNRV